ncbi:ABC transporter ATPase [Flavobacteriaceae bacterium]|jgi:hypothetical protein|nr:ABC transporter ATPase [Flavobacteriaceae bacterium]MDB2355272.1 ABC transporter ATPase [Flavobacteriaceae bacterium]MDC0910128.1 ABC transporter ATPase [Flavobacteriaceae bacterium]MDC1180627.1 ABC transporter ATPase [Flavobacteriaceae bacterium]MDC1371192.1 ABC transporter ATPase [Flavobacteriaceae bacterium]|tara:strand:+ start:391 stop:876 length:486 start_codon:yes stop_codon:yes gene_type:complete
MLVDFDTLNNESRVWVYQSNRTISKEETSEIELKIKDFLISWTAHGNDLEASFIIKYGRFIIISLNESSAKATGCSIDSSVRFIQGLEEQYNINLLDKMNVSYRHGEFIAYKPLIEFKKMIKNRSISKKTIVFNNLINNKSEFLNNWEVPIEESWHSRFFN